jgi:hypothetical protein
MGRGMREVGSQKSEVGSALLFTLAQRETTTVPEAERSGMALVAQRRWGAGVTVVRLPCCRASSTGRASGKSELGSQT